MSNTYWQRFLLRNDYAFDNIAEEVAREIAMQIMQEGDDSPVGRARKAMAERVLAGRDEVVARFLSDLKDRAVRDPAFRDPAFEQAKPGEDGVVRPRAMDIPDELLEAGVAGAWNDATLVAWPTILEDTAGVV